MTSDSPYREMIETLDPFVLVPALTQASSDAHLLRELMPLAMKPHRRPEDLGEGFVSRAANMLERVLCNRSGETSIPEDFFREMVNFAAGTEVPAEYLPMLLLESGVKPRAAGGPASLPRTAKGSAAPDVAIIGAGAVGIALGYHLRQAGIPFEIYEKNRQLGGTWTDARYPGCSVDTASHLYSFSFALNPDWPRHFSKQADVLDYLGRTAERFGLMERIHLGTAVESAVYDENTARWRFSLRKADGSTEMREAKILVSCVGQLNVPSIPKLPGLDGFEGQIIHTARWPAEFNPAGKRIALIGTAASAVQLGPTIAPEVAQLIVFQRSPQWLSHRPNYHHPVGDGLRRAFHEIPHFLNWYRLRLLWEFGDRLYPALLKGEDGKPSAANEAQRRIWTDYIRDKLQGRPDLLDKVLPDFPPLAKRVPVDFGWLDMLKRENVRLVTERLERVSAVGPVTADGVEHAVDAIIFATGYEATRMLQTIRVQGRQGVDLHQAWKVDDARAYLGMSVPGFPNFFIMYGPNTNLAHGGSLMFQGECQARYITAALTRMAEEGADEIECREAPFEAFNDELDKQIDRTVWVTPGVSNWFQNSQGRIVTNWPWSLQNYWERTSRFEPADFRLRKVR